MEKDMAYVAIEPCGCITAAMIANLETNLSVNCLMDSAKELEEWKKSGREVDLVNWEEAKSKFGMCKCNNKKEI